jgi:Uncharacterized protein conserved in bacteria
MKSNQNYNKELQPYAHKLRYSMTKAEACLRKYALRAKMMRGYTFNRQRPVGNYIVDFVCKELLLAIEVDGYSHLLEETIVKDNLKEDYLKKEGYRVLRFSDKDVLTDIKNVIRTIEFEINKILPLPPSEGENFSETIMSNQKILN